MRAQPPGVGPGGACMQPNGQRLREHLDSPQGLERNGPWLSRRRVVHRCCGPSSRPRPLASARTCGTLPHRDSWT
jgi:hypothetical protein